MEPLLNRVRLEAERVQQRTAQPRMAIVTSYNPDTYSIKAKLMPEGTETGWMPLGGLSVGNGFGVFSPVSVGDQIMVVHQEGSGGSPVAIAAVYSDEDRPVVEGIGSCPAGETWIVHRKGSRLRFLNDGTIEIKQQPGSQVILNPDGSVEINAPNVRIGQLAATFKKLVMETFMTAYNGHTHPNVGPPNSGQMTAAHLTTNLTGA